MSDESSDAGKYSTLDWSKIHESVLAFEAAWKRGERPVIENYLPDSTEWRVAIAKELILTDLEFRFKHGEEAAVEDYLGRFPELAKKPDEVLELVGAEMDFRRRAPLKTIPGYEILTKLNQGGMGIVYKARQLNLNRLVALKVMRGEVLDQPRHKARFQYEAQTVARLQHPNIIRIYDIDEVQERPYLSMELIDGCSLKERLDGQAQPLEATAQLIETLARVMHYVHELGIVHRDLKPSNVMLQRRQSQPSRGHDRPSLDMLRQVPLSAFEPKITDFGLAKDLDRDESLSATGNPIGTPSYMPPEQARGDKYIGPEADVYGLGAILYEMMTGRPPISGKSFLEIVDNVRVEVPVPPRQLRSDVSPVLEAICLRCLEKEPTQRYRFAEALARDLRAFLQGKPIESQAPPSPLAERVRVFINDSVKAKFSGIRQSWTVRAGYSIVRELGRHAHVISYLAKTNHGELVTLRVLQSGADATKKEWFWEEGRILGRLHHPNIPRLYELAEVEGNHFLATEYVEGVPLPKYCQPGELTWRQAARLGQTVARTLHYAHEQGIVHLDLLPAQILMTADGIPKVIHFGQVKDQNTQLTPQILESMRYGAPEQSTSDEPITVPSNVYTLGVILYELLAGRPPLEMNTLAAGIAQLNRMPEPPSRWMPSLPSALDTICLKCLAKAPGERFASAEALADELHQFLEAQAEE